MAFRTNSIKEFIVSLESGIERKKLMTGVSVYFGDNKSSNIPLIVLKACQYTVCQDHCQSNNLCTPETKKNCPKFTEQTMYILKWLAEQNEFTKSYPNGKTWLDLPLWFIKAFNIANSKLNEIQKATMDK